MYFCPNAAEWHRIHKRLIAEANLPFRGPDSPPIPLILGGWWASSASDKHRRWQETIRWAEAHGLAHVTSSVAADGFERWDRDEPPWNPDDDVDREG